CALLLAGLPPFSGFLAKFALLAPMLSAGTNGIILFALIITAGLGSIIALCRAGIQIFWEDDDWRFPPVHIRETTSVSALLGVGLIFTVIVAAPWQYLTTTANEVH